MTSPAAETDSAETDPAATDSTPAGSVPLVLVINRFDDEFGEYHRFVPDGTHRLAHLTTEDGLAPLAQDSAVATVVVPDLDYDTLLGPARRIAEEHGPFAGIVGVSEFDLLTAARLRAALDVPGWNTDYVRRFRDKTVMKKWVDLAGVRVPRYLEVGADTTAPQLVAQLGLPLVLKPRDGAASRGVRLIRTESELTGALAELAGEEYEAEEYVEGRIHHVDGIRLGGRYHFVTVSEYVNTCLDFARGTPLGSVLLDPGPLRTELAGFAHDCLDALELWDGPFHLELIVTPAGEAVFLEVGLRPGGAGVPFLHRDLYGIDLFGEAFRTTLGIGPLSDEGELKGVEASGGWLVFPEPKPWPTRLVDRVSLSGVVPEVYAEALPAPGHVFDGEGGYDHAGGRFLFRGGSQAAVHRAIREAIARYRLEVEPVTAAVER
ncbi:acetyl-CoA carboxylase biotin carboxylase subunit family protein [Streptomyces mauvecolor]|uniref:Acetyl-CoA carboxylase biotin carboxylase subunit family protein n=1 Tax=Streptomyces mauvecolor TaxID=58345 RepID=A0ABV9UEW7_9ACTN